MTIKVYPELIQGSDEWLEARRGVLTASEMKLILTPTLKAAANEKERCHLYEIAAQRISGYVEPTYITNDMLRGQEDEIYARAEYAKHYAEVSEVGFITNDQWGFTLGFSPDGLVGDDGFIEIKSRRQKFQVQTVIENEVSSEYVLQIQTGLLVSGRTWCDFVTYCGGLHMMTLRVHPDPFMQEAIVEAATKFEVRVSEKINAYRARLGSGMRLVPTERHIQQEITP